MQISDSRIKMRSYQRAQSKDEGENLHEGTSRPEAAILFLTPDHRVRELYDGVDGSDEGMNEIYCLQNLSQDEKVSNCRLCKLCRNSKLVYQNDRAESVFTRTMAVRRSIISTRVDSQTHNIIIYIMVSLIKVASEVRGVYHFPPS